LPREAVAASQRTRILEATIEVVASRGYPETRVVDVIGAAGVSRKTFYELFDDREQCFLGAYDAAVGVLLHSTRRGYESAEMPWADRVRLGTGALLNQLADRPAAAKACIVEVLAAGPAALARRDAAMRQFTEFIDGGRAESSIELPGITSLALVGGIYELLYSEILHGATAQLPSRLPEIVYWITQPFLGSEAASEHREKTREMIDDGQIQAGSGASS
jgi:AcrR family transcriptional regulator